VRREAGPWHGPTELDLKDKLPGYKTTIPDNFRVYTIAAANFEAWANCYYAIYDNEIGFIFHKQFNLAGETWRRPSG